MDRNKVNWDCGKERRRHVRIRPGFSLIESLMTLSLFSFAIVGCMEFIDSFKNHYHRLKQDYEIEESIFAAEDKISSDIREAGRGLLIPIELGLLKAISAEGEGLSITLRDKDLIPKADLHSGQTRIELESTTGVKKHHVLCIHRPETGENITVADVHGRSVILAAPLEHAYPLESVTVAHLKTIVITLDESSHILRRKVNASPAQPLLDDVSDFYFSFDPSSRLAYFRVRHSRRKENEHVQNILPKNLLLADYD